jgi:hypothetical protein
MEALRYEYMPNYSYEDYKQWEGEWKVNRWYCLCHGSCSHEKTSNVGKVLLVYVSFLFLVG